MKAALLGLVILLGGAWLAAAADRPVEADLTKPSSRYLTWDDPAWWDYMARKAEPKVMVGRSDVSVTGPLIQPFRARRAPPPANILDRLTLVPILGLFVPQPMPKPPVGGGKYFEWGDRSVAWSDLADRPIPGPTGVVSFSY